MLEMIVNRKYVLECAIPFNKGWCCFIKNNGIGHVINVLGEIQKIEDAYTIHYDRTNKCPIFSDGFELVWQPEIELLNKRRYYTQWVNEWETSGGSKQKEYIVVPGKFFPSNYYDQSKEGQKQEKEESHYLLVAGDGTSKLLKLDLPIEGASISQDTQTILAFGSKGFIVLDNPLI